jgi:hypothetical protein
LGKGEELKDLKLQWELAWRIELIERWRLELNLVVQKLRI